MGFREDRKGVPRGLKWGFAAENRIGRAVTPPPRCEQVPVSCRSNGSITVDIFHAPTASAPILLYLPPGPVLPACSQEEERVISTLRESSAATVVRVNYRASSAHQYPTPCHDVLTGYDWVRDNLLLDKFNRPYLARLGVCGELIGGALATMLALTECRLGESRIVAAAVNNPLVDWVFPDDFPVVSPEQLPEPQFGDETALPADDDLADSWTTRKIDQDVPNPEPEPEPKHRKRKPKPPPLTAWQAHGDNAILPTLTLSGERDVLFRRSEHYFDRFASPMHFFRSPHAQLVFPQQDDNFASQQPDVLLDIETQLALNHYSTFDNNMQAAPGVPTLERCRAYARIYPPAGANISLPVWNITTGLQSPLSDQSLELAKMIRRSIARQTLKSHSGRTRWHNAAEKDQYEEFAQGRVQLNAYQGLGLWTQQDHNKDWKQHVEEIGVWMKQRLEPGFT
ncbi:alpha/beta-hydrolase [Decorospora gaudefroyi]|uniref:Alpha/beta-hydrolase n=1 Tax=Decorospora gaudefroyi TaxID=184978 RepID=A0A6A5JYC7_9PLEO|nr:alpha/beta-hydrolase [Decorospora gaudefroyi]